MYFGILSKSQKSEYRSRATTGRDYNWLNQMCQKYFLNYSMARLCNPFWTAFRHLVFRWSNISIIGSVLNFLTHCQIFLLSYFSMYLLKYFTQGDKPYKIILERFYFHHLNCNFALEGMVWAMEIKKVLISETKLQ